MNKKGFTLVELLGVIVLIAILAGLAVISVNHIINSGKMGLYKNYENTLENATRNYFIDNINDMPSVNSSKNISYNTLLNGKYIEEFKDPNKGDCSLSYTEVTRGENVGNNFNIKYKPCLICKNGEKINYISKDCSSEIEVNDTVVLTFNANGGTVSITSKELDKNSTTYGTLPEPTRDGYTFTGWYTQETGGTKVLSTTPFTYGTSVQTLYAHWNKVLQSTTMTLSSSSGTISCGGSTSINVTTNGDGTLNCSTSNDTISSCSVNGTKVTISGKSGQSGSAIITVSQTEGTNYAATSEKYNLTINSCSSWHYVYYGNSGGDAWRCVHANCEEYCFNNVDNGVDWSCIDSESTPPLYARMETGKYCWCLY